MARGPKGHGRSHSQFRKVREQVLRADDRCWLCGHPGADTVDHIETVAELVARNAPVKAFNDPRNLRPAHGRRRPDLGCPGNFSRKKTRDAPPAPRRRPQSREW